MAKSSVAGPGVGVENPNEVESVHVNSDTDPTVGPDERPTLVVMWHGNSYNREDCWLQIDEDAACDLTSWE